MSRKLTDSYETQAERISGYEKMMDEALALIESGEMSERLAGLISELGEYYQSPEWKIDYADDEAGRLPAGLKRGVLSQDGLYDLLERYDAYVDSHEADGGTSMKYYLYNPLANNGIRSHVPGTELIDASKIDYPEFFADLKEGDEVVLIGGDGTINYFINAIDPAELRNNVYLYGNGSGNDFLNDIGEKPGKEILLNPYLTDLPVATVNGKRYRYINNMSFGIDGYCCEEADKIKARKPNKKINYTAIAIKGLLYAFRPRHAWIEVDGREYEFDDCWLAPAMKGRYCGGGMMLAPGQDRKSGRLTVIVYMSKSKLKSLRNFPLIFEGKHVNLTDMVRVIEGNKVHVRFSEPCAVQIDGETILDVTEYWAEQ